MPKTPHITHEAFVQSVRALALEFALARNTLKPDELARVLNAKLVYGRGRSGLRGITQYGGWQNGQCDELIEICAAGEENWTQLAGTTIHELAHAATGIGHGHGKAWKRLCEALGLRRVLAGGTFYRLANFAPSLRMGLAALAHPTDGNPVNSFASLGQLYPIKARPCSAGIGINGGTSRGKGSGSRLRLYVCPHGQKIRASTDTLQATCGVCGGTFAQPGSEPAIDPAALSNAFASLLGGAGSDWQ